MVERTSASRAAKPVGVSAFKILANRRAVASLRALETCRCSAGKVATLIGERHPTVYKDLDNLRHAGAVIRLGEKGRFLWELTDAGRALLAIEDTTAELGRRVPAIREQACADWLEQLLAGLADHHMLAVLRELFAGGQMRPVQLDQILKGSVTHRYVHERLQYLTQVGAAEHTTVRSGSYYSLKPDWQALSYVLLLGARWEWAAGRPEHPEIAGDLGTFTALLCAAATPAPARGGVCRLVLEDPLLSTQATAIELRDSSLRVLAAPPAGTAHATAVARPLTWFDALLYGRTAGLRVEGDKELVGEAIGALHAAAAAVGNGRPLHA